MPLNHLLLKQKITGQTNNNGRIDNVEIMVPLKYLLKQFLENSWNVIN